MEKKLENKVAIITGAGKGIGKASAQLFAQHGARVVVADIDEDSGRQTVAEIEAQGGVACFIRVDVTSSEQVIALVDQVEERYRRIDVLFNNAAINLFAKTTDTSVEAWDRLMAVNVKGVFLCCKYTIPVMQKNGGGVIINTGSAASLVGLKNLAAYTASKGAVIQYTKNLALDYAVDHIRANTLCPGVTLTEMTLKMIETSSDPQATRERYNRGRPLGRLAEPVEIARAALFLASEDSSYMTGTSITVDGGYTAE